MRGKRGRHEDLNYWPSIADFMLALFMVALILGLTNIVLLYSQQKSHRTEGNLVLQENKNLIRENQQLIIHNKKLNEDLQAYKKNIEEKITKLEAEKNSLITYKVDVEVNIIPKVTILEAEINSLKEDKGKLEIELSKTKDFQHEKKPPNIEYFDTKGGLTFASNSANTKGFENFLEADASGFNKWKDIITKQHPEVNTIEIIGHTDNRNVSTVGNLDKLLLNGLRSNLKPDEMKSGSNADLGLWRSIAVMRQWKEWVEGLPDSEEKKRLQQIEVRCYSAAYGIPPKNPMNLVGDSINDISRRIEIRFTELQK